MKKPQMKEETRKKIDNFWYYYKIHVLVVVFILFVAGVFIKDIVTKVDYDYSVAFVTEEMMTDEEISSIQSVLEKEAEDLSLSEIAGEAGISRQGVHDLIKRCQKALEGYEEKLHLVEKFLSIKEKVHEIDSVLDAYESGAGNQKPQEMIEKIRKISDTIIEEL